MNATEGTWISRDKKVLEALVKLDTDPLDFVEASDIEQETGFARDTVQSSLHALKHAGYFNESHKGNGMGISMVRGVTGDGRRAVGAWPDPERVVDELVNALKQAAKDEPDNDKRANLIKASTFVGGAARDVVTGVLTGYIVGS